MLHNSFFTLDHSDPRDVMKRTRDSTKRTARAPKRYKADVEPTKQKEAKEPNLVKQGKETEKKTKETEEVKPVKKETKEKQKQKPPQEGKAWVVNTIYPDGQEIIAVGVYTDEDKVVD